MNSNLHPASSRVITVLRQRFKKSIIWRFNCGISNDESRNLQWISTHACVVTVGQSVEANFEKTKQNIRSCIPIIPPTPISGVSVGLSDVVTPLTLTHIVETTPRQPKRNPARYLHFALLLLLRLNPPSRSARTPGHTSSKLPEQGKKGNMLIGVKTSWLLVIITVKKCTENFSRDILSVCPSKLRHWGIKDQCGELRSIIKKKTARLRG